MVVDMIGYRSPRHDGRSVWAAVPAAVALGLFVTSPSPAAAGSCAAQVDAMAAAHHLTVDPPNAKGMPPTPGEGPRRLGKSGGVIEPPKVDDPAVIAPRDIEPGDRGVRYGMPTMPELSPNASPAMPNGTTTTLNAQDRAILESLLVAARARAEQGDEAACFRKLEMAQAFLEDRT
jgi:hypothetical protein